MENEEKKLQEEKVKEATDAPKVDEKKKKPSKTWEAMMRTCSFIWRSMLWHTD